VEVELQERITGIIRQAGLGGRLPTERELAQRCSATRHQVRIILGDLEERGVISRKRRVGSTLSIEAERIHTTPVHLFRKDLSDVVEDSPSWWSRKCDLHVDQMIAAKEPGIRLESSTQRPTPDSMRLTGRPTILHSGHSQIREGIGRGLCADITDRLNTWPERGEVWPNLWEPVTVNGRVYGAPLSAHVFVLLCNAKRFRACGLNPDSPPGTWDELIESSRRMTDASQGLYGLAFPQGSSPGWRFVDLCFQAGGTVIREHGGVWTPAFHEPAGQSALSFLHDLRWRWKVMPPDPLDSEGSLKALFEDRIGMCWVQASAGLTALVRSGRSPADFEVAPLPAGPHGHAAQQVSIHAALINAHAPATEQDAAWRYVRRLAGPEIRAEHSRFVWRRRVVMDWPSSLRCATAAQTGVNLPQAWFNTLTAIVAQARPEPTAMGWNADAFLTPLVRRALMESDVDIAEEAALAARLAERTSSLSL